MKDHSIGPAWQAPQLERWLHSERLYPKLAQQGMIAIFHQFAHMTAAKACRMFQHFLGWSVWTAGGPLSRGCSQGAGGVRVPHLPWRPTESCGPHLRPPLLLGLPAVPLRHLERYRYLPFRSGGTEKESQLPGFTALNSWCISSIRLLSVLQNKSRHISHQQHSSALCPEEQVQAQFNSGALYSSWCFRLQ